MQNSHATSLKAVTLRHWCVNQFCAQRRRGLFHAQTQKDRKRWKCHFWFGWICQRRIKLTVKGNVRSVSIHLKTLLTGKTDRHYLTNWKNPFFSVTKLLLEFSFLPEGRCSVPRCSEIAAVFGCQNWLSDVDLVVLLFFFNFLLQQKRFKETQRCACSWGAVLRVTTLRVATL